MLQLLPPIYAIYRQPAGLGALLRSRRSTIRLWWSAAVWAGRLAALAAVLGLMQIVAAAAVPAPVAAAVPAVPKAYVGIFNDNTVAVVDTGANRVLGTIPVPTGPHGLVMSPDGRRVYASSDGASSVSVISTLTDRVVSTIEVGRSPHGLAISPDGRRVLVAVYGASQVAMIDTVRNEVVARIPVGSPHNIAITPDGHRAYVASQVQGSAALVVVDVASRSVVGRVALDNVPRALNFSPDGKQLYFTEAGVSAVQVLDPASNTVKGQIPVGASPHHPLFVGSGGTALVVVQGPGQLAVIDTASEAVTAVPVGQMPHWIAVSSESSLAYVTNENSNDVSVVSLNNNKVVATVAITFLSAMDTTDTSLEFSLVT